MTGPGKNRKRYILPTVLGLGVIFIILCTVLIVHADREVEACSGYVWTDVEKLPEREYGLLLGTARIVQGKYLNQYFLLRIEGAVKLYRLGKIRKIVVSGDNSRKEYNETEDMKQALMEHGVPEKAIVMDYAGFRTLDSLLRARNLFGLRRYTVISQQFHCKRAVYLAREHGLDVIGFAAEEVSPKFRFKRYFREPLARCKAWLDIHILHTRPHFEKW